LRRDQMTTMRKIETLDEAEAAIHQTGHVLLVFSSDLCPDCTYLETYIEAVEANYPHIGFYTIKRDQLPEMFNHYNIFGVPSLLLYKNGNLEGMYIDKKRKTKQQVEAFIDTTLRKGDE